MTTTDDISPLRAFAREGHAFFARDGVKLAFGRGWDNKIIHISQAVRGGACGCKCPECGQKLIAKKPDSDMAHHFAHAPMTPAERAAGIAPNCKHGNMTALHAYAEQLLNSRKNLVLPPVAASVGKYSKQISGAKSFAFDNAVLEKMYGETIPDVILYKGERRLQVEVYVTNRCGSEKRAKIAAADISALEIDLSALPRDVTLDELDKAILETAPREWIYNRKVKQLRDELEQFAKAEATLAKKKLHEQADKLNKTYQLAASKALQSYWKCAQVIEVTEAGDAELLEGPIGGGGEGYFSVHPKVWKAAIVSKLLSNDPGVTPASVVSELHKRGWVVESFFRMEKSHDPILAEADLPEGGVKQVVLNFLEFLSHQGVVEDIGWAWKQTRGRSAQLIRRRQDRELLEREAVEREDRRKTLAKLGTAISLFGNEQESQNFDVAAWMDHGRGNAISLNQIADEGGLAWRELKTGLTTTLAVLKDESEEIADDFSLPVRNSLQAMRAVHEARSEQRRLEAAKIARSESLQRIDDLLAATTAMGDDADLWIDAPNSDLWGLTPREAAVKSYECLAEAIELARIHSRELMKKAEWLEKFKQEALKFLGRDDAVAVYLNCSHPKLPGKTPPKDYIKDDQTMQFCLNLLKPSLTKR